jgi:hypothetical protein
MEKIRNKKNMVENAKGRHLLSSRRWEDNTEIYYILDQ